MCSNNCNTWKHVLNYFMCTLTHALSLSPLSLFLSPLSLFDPLPPLSLSLSLSLPLPPLVKSITLLGIYGQSFTPLRSCVSSSSVKPPSLSTPSDTLTRSVDKGLIIIIACQIPPGGVWIHCQLKIWGTCGQVDAFILLYGGGVVFQTPLLQLINARGSRQGPVAGPLGRSLFFNAICIVLIFSVVQTEQCTLVLFTLHTCSGLSVHVYIMGIYATSLVKFFDGILQQPLFTFSSNFSYVYLLFGKLSVFLVVLC